jgi:hypothetical protein
MAPAMLRPDSVGLVASRLSIPVDSTPSGLKVQNLVLPFWISVSARDYCNRADDLRVKGGLRPHSKVNKTISGRVPTRTGGPQVPAPQDV